MVNFFYLHFFPPQFFPDQTFSDHREFRDNFFNYHNFFHANFSRSNFGSSTFHGPSSWFDNARLARSRGMPHTVSILLRAPTSLAARARADRAADRELPVAAVLKTVRLLPVKIRANHLSVICALEFLAGLDSGTPAAHGTSPQVKCHVPTRPVPQGPSSPTGLEVPE